jgi:hypothetical protein
MKKMLLIVGAATALAVAFAAASKRPIRQPEQPAGEWKLAPERHKS